jgi:hypothetical protein
VAKLCGLKDGPKKLDIPENASSSKILPKLKGLKKFPRNWSSFRILS